MPTHIMNILKLTSALLAKVLCLIVSASCAWSAELPKALRQQAGKAFADGHRYFIWTTEKQPLKGEDLPFGSFVGINVHFLASDKQKPEFFRVKVELTGIDSERKLGTTFESVSGKQDTGERGGETTTGLIAEGKKLTGSGTAKVYLIADADEKAKSPKPLSNTLEVKVEFSEKK